MRFGLIAYPQKPLIIAHSGVSRGTRCLKVVRSLLQLAYFVYARSESSGEVMRTCRLFGAFATREVNVMLKEPSSRVLTPYSKT